MSANTQQDALAQNLPDLQHRPTLLNQVTSSFSEIPAMTFQKLWPTKRSRRSARTNRFPQRGLWVTALVARWCRSSTTTKANPVLASRWEIHSMSFTVFNLSLDAQSEESYPHVCMVLPRFSLFIPAALHCLTMYCVWLCLWTVFIFYLLNYLCKGVN